MERNVIVYVLGRMHNGGWAAYFQAVANAVAGNPRLIAIAEQAKDSGVTSIMWVVDMSNEYQDFPWALLAQSVHEATEIAAEEVCARTHPYGMFSDVAAERTPLYLTKFPNMAYAAKQILIEVHGDQAAKGYEGSHQVKHKAMIDAWEQAYKTATAAGAPQYPGQLQLPPGQNQGAFGARLG